MKYGDVYQDNKNAKCDDYDHYRKVASLRCFKLKYEQTKNQNPCK